MKRFLLLGLFAIFIVNTVGCEGLYDNPAPEEFEEVLEYEFHKDVKYYDKDLASWLSLVNDTTMFIGSGMPSEHVPDVGNVILCPNTTSTPHGFLRRVTSIDNGSGGMTVYTESATLEDAFYSLKLDQEINLADYVKEMRDSLGNEVPFEVVSGEVWNHLNPGDTTSLEGIPTKAALESDVSHAFKFPVFGGRTFDGMILMDIDAHVKLDIGFGKINEVSYTLERKTGLCGKVMLSTNELIGEEYEDGWSISLAELYIPIATPIGPAFMQFFPNLNFELAFVGKTDLSIGAEFRYIVEHTRTTYSYVDGVENHSVTNLMDTNENYMTLLTAEIAGEMGIKASAGLELRLWNGDWLAFGGEAGYKCIMEAKSKISMSDKELLAGDNSIEVKPSMFMALYVESFLINKRSHRLETTSDVSFNNFELRLFPKIEYEVSDSSLDKLVVQPAVKPVSMMQTTEEGFALFSSEDPDTPLEHKKLPAAVVPDDTPSGGDSDVKFTDVEIVTEPLEFELPSSEKSYFVKPYVIAGGKHYYGEGRRKRLKRWNSRHELHYDDKGRVIKYVDTRYNHKVQIEYDDAGGKASIYEDGYYSGTVIIRDGLVTSLCGDDITYDSDGNMIKSGLYANTWEDGNIVSSTYRGTEGTDHSEYTYGTVPNMMNMDLWASYNYEIPTYFIYFVSKPLTKFLPICRKSNHGSTHTYSYVFDDDGYVTKAVEDFDSPFDGSGQEIFTFEYEIY